MFSFVKKVEGSGKGLQNYLTPLQYLTQILTKQSLPFWQRIGMNPAQPGRASPDGHKVKQIFNIVSTDLTIITAVSVKIILMGPVTLPGRYPMIFIDREAGR